MDTEMMAAYGRFTKAGPSMPFFCQDGDYLASVSLVGGYWTWTVWRDNDRGVVGGDRAYEMTAYEACAAAIECIKATRSVPRQSFFADEI